MPVRGKHRLNHWAKKALVKSRSLRIAASLKPPAAMILMYHSVRDEPELDADWIGPGITHATKIFARHMELLARQFNPVTLDDILLFLQGERTFPRRAVAVTFDDGYLDNLQVAAPVLNRFGISAAFYVTVGLIGKAEAPWFCRVRHAFMMTPRCTWRSSGQQRTWDLSSAHARGLALLSAYDLCAPLVGGAAQQQAVRTIEEELEVEPGFPRRRLMLSWDEARALRRAGHILGSHTITHPNLAHVEQEEALRAEFVQSKRELEEHFEEQVTHFSYPHPALDPQWNEKTLAITRDAGYATAVTTTSGPVLADANPLLLKRIDARQTDDEFLWNLERTLLQS